MKNRLLLVKALNAAAGIGKVNQVKKSRDYRMRGIRLYVLNHQPFRELVERVRAAGVRSSRYFIKARSPLFHNARRVPDAPHLFPRMRGDASSARIFYTACGEEWI